MSTRQHRLNSVDEIRKKSKDLTDRKVNIVMNDNTVLLATVKSAETSWLDVVNMRLKKVRIPFDSITEIYYDTKE
jgi:hypothetical protein